MDIINALMYNNKEYYMRFLKTCSNEDLGKIYNGTTILILICEFRRHDAFELIKDKLKYCNINFCEIEIENYNALLYACSKRLSKIAMKLITDETIILTNRNYNNDNALTICAKNNMYNVALELIKRMDINDYGFIYRDLNSNLISNELMSACIFGTEKMALMLFDYQNPSIFCEPYLNIYPENTLLLYALENNYEKLCMRLLEYPDKCNIAYMNKENKTALLLALRNEMFDVVDILIEHYSENDIKKLNIYDTYNNLLYCALYNDMGCYIPILINKGARLSEHDIYNFFRKYDSFDLDYDLLAFFTKDVINNYITYDTISSCIFGNKYTFLKKIMKYIDYYSVSTMGRIKDYCECDKCSNCRFMCEAIRMKNDKICNLLLKYPIMCDVGYSCKHKNIFHFAIKHLKERTCLKLLNKINMRDVNYIDNKGNTSLMIAISQNYNILANKLLNKCNINAINNTNNTALVLAIKNNMPNIYYKILDNTKIKISISVMNNLNQSAMSLALLYDNDDLKEKIYSKMHN